MNQKSLHFHVVRIICSVLVVFQLNSFTIRADETQIAQTQTISGTVSDKTGEPLIGVSVVVKGTTNGVLTDLDGQFSIEAPIKGILVFSYIGFNTQEQSTRSKKLNIVLRESQKDLDEVVVVAYGSQRKETITGAVSVVKGSKLAEVPAANITNTLAGKLPGVTVSQNSGRPGGDAAKIYIRGITSWTSATPLIIIDGIEQPSFDFLDPNDISSISVLKDASSTAVYGIRGANGVILITTKRGTVGKPQINLSANWGTQSPTKTPEYLGSYDHMLLKRVAYNNDGLTWEDNMSDAALEAFRTGSDPYRYPDVNWYDLMMKGTKNPIQQYNLNVTGGTQRVKYFIALGYLNQKGAINYQNLQKDYDPTAYFTRMNLRSNIDFTVNKYVTISANISGRSEDQNGVRGINGSSTDVGGTGGFYQQLMAREPWRFEPFNPDGSIGAGNGYGNPIAPAAYGGYDNKRMNYFDFIGSLNVDLGFVTPGLNFSSSVSYNSSYGSTKSYRDDIDTYAYNPDQPVGQQYTQLTENSPFSYNGESYAAIFNRLSVQMKLGYTKTFGLHKLNTILVYNQQKTLKNDTRINNTQIRMIPYALMGYAARAEYSYANKYLAEVSVGYNGSENFAEGHRFGVFPAFSLGYVLSEEKFMEPIKSVLQYFKIRGSIGLVGNDQGQGDRFLYLAQYSTSSSGAKGSESFSFGTQFPSANTGIVETRGYNPDLTWETSLKKDIGIEGSLFNNKLLSFSADIFREDRKNILMQGRSTPSLVGLAAPYGNIGKTRGWGYELELSHRNKIGNVEYGIAGNYSFARNEVVFKDDAPKTPDYKKDAGYRIGQIRGYQVIGFFQNQAEIDSSPTQAGHTVPGDLKYKDTDDDGKITANDMVPMGYSNLPEISYSVTPSVSWKGISFEMMFQGVANVSMMFTGNAIYEFAGSAGGGNVSPIHQNYWTPDNPNPSYPSLHWDPNHSNKNPNSIVLDAKRKFLEIEKCKIKLYFSQ